MYGPIGFQNASCRLKNAETVMPLLDILSSYLVQSHIGVRQVAIGAGES